jgi:hypothetical protein
MRYYLFLHRLRKKIERDPAPYTDRASTPVEAEEGTSRRAPLKRSGATAAA